MKEANRRLQCWSIGNSQALKCFSTSFLVWVVMLVSSCSQDVQKIPLKRTLASAENANRSSFCPTPSSSASASSSAAMSLVTAKCSSCHAAGATAPDLSTPQNIVAAQSAILRSTSAGSMPPGGKLGSVWNLVSGVIFNSKVRFLQRFFLRYFSSSLLRIIHPMILSLLCEFASPILILER